MVLQSMINRCHRQADTNASIFSQQWKKKTKTSDIFRLGFPHTLVHTKNIYLITCVIQILICTCYTSVIILYHLVQKYLHKKRAGVRRQLLMEFYQAEKNILAPCEHRLYILLYMYFCMACLYCTRGATNSWSQCTELISSVDSRLPPPITDL